MSTRSASGWKVFKHAQDDGKPFLARAWDPNEHAYRYQRFDSVSAGQTWAKDEAARLRTGQSQAGRMPIEPLIDEWIAEVRLKGAVEAYVVEIERILKEAVAAGMTDLRHPRVLYHAQTFLTNARTVGKYRAGRALSPSTLNRYREALRAFGNWAVRWEKTVRNPFRNIPMLREPEFLKPVFRLDELATLVDPSRQDDPYWLMFCVLVYTGCRRQEAAHLRWEAIDWRSRRIAVMLSDDYALKCKKERLVPLQPELEALLKPRDRQSGFVLDGFVRSRSARAQVGRFAAYLRRCKVPDGDRTPHSTRHTWVSLMLASGLNQILVQTYAGHVDLETTAGYAKSQERYRDAVRDWKPGEFKLIQKETAVATADEPAEIACPS
jgi:integrase